MRIATVHVRGVSPYSQSRHYGEEVPKMEKEGSDEYERRTWRHRMHVNKDGFVEIPGASFANSLKNAARRLKIQIPGKGRTEFTKYIEAGIMCPDPVVLPVKADEVECDSLFVPSDGRPGGGKRVMKFFPRIEPGWSGSPVFWILDDIIRPDVFEKCVRAAGMTVGLGRFRPENRGFYGRFAVDKVDWAEIDESNMVDHAAE